MVILCFLWAQNSLIACTKLLNQQQQWQWQQRQISLVTAVTDIPLLLSHLIVTVTVMAATVLGIPLSINRNGSGRYPSLSVATAAMVVMTVVIEIPLCSLSSSSNESCSIVTYYLLLNCMWCGMWGHSTNNDSVPFAFWTPLWTTADAPNAWFYSSLTKQPEFHSNGAWIRLSSSI